MARQQWEIARVAMLDRYRAERPTGEGYEIIREEHERSGSPDKDDARLLAQLGREGWELVAVTSGMIWFKRPVEPTE